MLGTATFSILVVGTLLVLNKLFGFIMFQAMGIEPNSEGFSTILISVMVVLLILTIALPTIATRVILRKFS